MPRQDVHLEWTVIDDFSPGLYLVPGTKHPLGSASDQTWRCIGGVNGALIPGPRSTYAIDHAPYEADPDDLETQDKKYWIDGFATNPVPVYGGLGNPYPGPDQDNNELWFGFEYYSNDEAHLRVAKYRFNRSNPGERWQDIYSSDTPGNATQYTRPRRCFFASGRTIATGGNPDQAGVPVMAWTFDLADAARISPDPDSTGSISSAAMPAPTGGNVYRVVSHQGRMVLTPLSLYGQGSSQVGVTTESMYWTEFNDLRTLDTDLGGLYYKVIFGHENPNGYADMHSLTADELLAFKTKGGALLWRGDLDDPTVHTLPNVMSPGFAMSKGTPSPIGYAYCVQGSGLWVWGGGDVSEHLSPQMPANFWRPVDDEAGYYWKDTNLCSWNEWIILPNGYLYDTTTRAFWRYARHRFYFHDTSWDHRWMYATLSRFDHEDRFVAYRWDKLQRARSFRWTSNVMPASISRKINVREGVVVASGTGTVTVRIITGDGNQQERTYEVNTTMPAVVGRLPFSIKGTHIQVQLDSVGADSTFDGAEGELDAPTIYGVAIGANERMHVGR